MCSPGQVLQGRLWRDYRLLDQRQMASSMLRQGERLFFIHTL